MCLCFRDCTGPRPERSASARISRFSFPFDYVAVLIHLVLLSLWGFLRVSASLLYSIYGLLYPLSGYNLCMGAQIRSEISDASQWCPKICVTSRNRMLTINPSKATRLRRNMHRYRLWSGMQEGKFFDSHRRAEIFDVSTSNISLV